MAVGQCLQGVTDRFERACFHVAEGVPEQYLVPMAFRGGSENLVEGRVSRVIVRPITQVMVLGFWTSGGSGSTW